MPKKKSPKRPVPKKSRKKFSKSQIPKEKEKLQARLAFLLDEVDDYWFGKRGKSSHILPIFKEYWRLVDIAVELYANNYIFEELDISDATQPNADDLQALEMDVEKMLLAFEMDLKGNLDRLFSRLTLDSC